MKRSVVVMLAFAASAAAAQQGSKADPSDPSLRVPAPAYRSVFAGYRPYKEDGPARWREANEEVGRSGGHAGHAAPSGAGPKPEAKTPPRAEHGGHK